MPEYFDPALWLRLEPAVERERAMRAENLTRGSSASFEHYREAVGYLRALDWVLATAKELTRVEENE